jgi:hypothetical protein
LPRMEQVTGDPKKEKMTYFDTLNSHQKPSDFSKTIEQTDREVFKCAKNEREVAVKSNLYPVDTLAFFVPTHTPKGGITMPPRSFRDR